MRPSLLLHHVRSLFGPWHLIGAVALTVGARFWPAGSPDEIAFLHWALKRAELLGPLAVMGLTSGVLQVGDRVDERWGAVPLGLGRLFLQRWFLAMGYAALAQGLFLALAGKQDPLFSWWRTFPSALITSAFFSLAGSLAYFATGSARTGWATGMTLYFSSLTISQFWCPADSVYQLWLPFAGLSSASGWALAASKAGYGLAGSGLLWASLRVLRTPERLIGRAPD